MITCGNALDFLPILLSRRLHRWLDEPTSTAGHRVPDGRKSGSSTTDGHTSNAIQRRSAPSTRSQSEERNRAILEAVPDLMFLQTLDGVYLDYRAKDRRDLLAPPEDFLGKYMRDVLPPALAEALAQRF